MFMTQEDTDVRRTALTPPRFAPMRLPVRAPACDGLHMPAEWEPHAGCWMAWPCPGPLWLDALEPARASYANVARAIARFEPVTMLARPEDAQAAAALCGPTVNVLPAPIEDAWMRDFGPTFLVDGAGGVAGVHWLFNAWGHTYDEPTHDDGVAQLILSRLGMRRYAAPFILEGGSIHVDGQGTLITTEQCLLDPRRNAGMTKADFEELFAAYLGVRKVVWLGEGLEGDDTHGHVDIVASFARPGVVLLHRCDDPDDHNHSVYQDNLRRLELTTDACGRPFEIIPIDQPSRVDHGGRRMDLSYINFYVANGGIVMSAFGGPGEPNAQDRAAFETLRRVFPGREVVQVHSLDIFRGGGGIHCITQQQPTGRPLPPF
ncbi:agmatine deiminase family protein [Nitratidesulfovibrio termitidis]|uniref:agmatine deiminase family protein n=1 Tax=Nitratidesulfovibrio termitidis TaxID=42252 RepID=UPI001FDF2E12|nr:agmatine deiminase family protein [Nitratidesulfovibrio termitidis]